MNQKKTALALGGGGSRGSYQAGVCQALNQLNRHFDVVTGTSIGAICGSIYIQNKVSTLEEWMGGFTQQSVARNLFMFPQQYQIQDVANQPINKFLEGYMKDGPSIAPLKDLLEKIFDYDAFEKAKEEYACISYNVTQNKEAFFHKQDMTRDNALDCILSSTAYFPAFNMVEIAGDYYLDGGYCKTRPWDLAADMDANAITAVVLKNYAEEPHSIATDEIFPIYPLLNLAYYLDFEGDTMTRQAKQGYLEALKYLDQAPGYLYTFYPEDWDHMLHLEDLALGLLVKAGKADLLENLNPVMDEIYQFLLGYIPRPLKNKYSGQFIFGRILECMGLIAGIDLYEQIHFKDFIHQILEHFKELDSNPNKDPKWEMFNEMEQKGLKDLMVFFHTAILSYGGNLPKTFDVFKAKFLLPYYLGWAWYVMDKFQLVFYL